MYIRILKRQPGYVAEVVKEVFLEEDLKLLCSKLRSRGIKRRMFIVDPDSAFHFDASEMSILEKCIPN